MLPHVNKVLLPHLTLFTSTVTDLCHLRLSKSVQLGAIIRKSRHADPQNSEQNLVCVSTGRQPAPVDPLVIWSQRPDKLAMLKQFRLSRLLLCTRTSDLSRIVLARLKHTRTQAGSQKHTHTLQDTAFTLSEKNMTFCRLSVYF